MFIDPKIQEAKLNTLIPAYNSACDTLDSLESKAQSASNQFINHKNNLEIAICKHLGNIFVTYKPKNVRYYFLELETDKKYQIIRFSNSQGVLQATLCCVKSSLKECMDTCKGWDLNE